MRLDPRLDSVFSTRDEKHHADLRAKESGGVSAVRILGQFRLISNRMHSTMAATSPPWNLTSTAELPTCSL